MKNSEIERNKKEFIAIVKSNIKRKGIEKVIAALENSDFFTAPASRNNHDNEEGGLCNHSLRVRANLMVEINDISTKLSTGVISNESANIVALFHDICKIHFYSISYRNNKNEKGVWEKVPYYTIDDKLPLGHGEKSVIMLMQLMELTTDEIFAIRWHMGLSVPKEEYGSMSKAFEQCPLALLLHIADMKAAYLK